MEISRSIFLGTVLLAASLAVSADINEGRTADDRLYVTGGIGQGEVEQLQQRADKFSLQLIVSSRSGAYLADMDVSITGTNNQKVLQTQLNAPWLLVDLAPGTYKVSVAHAGKTQERNVTVAPGKREKMVVQFDVPADTAGPKTVSK